MSSTTPECPESEYSSSNDGTYYYLFLGEDKFSYWKHVGAPLVVLLLLIILNIKLIKLLKDKIIKLKSPNT